MSENSRYSVKGQGNEIIAYRGSEIFPNADIKGLNITINGNNNKIMVELPVNLISVSIVVDGDNNKFIMKSTKHRKIRHTVFGLEGGSTISLGSGISAYRDIHIVAKNGKNITIGDECMFAREIKIRNNDAHVIVDRETGEVINPPEDIVLEDRVWVGTRAMILKGSYIPEGCVVGAMALVNKKFDTPNSILGGVPAKIIRSNIEWRRQDYATYMQENEDL